MDDLNSDELEETIESLGSANEKARNMLDNDRKALLLADLVEENLYAKDFETAQEFAEEADRLGAGFIACSTCSFYFRQLVNEGVAHIRSKKGTLYNTNVEARVWRKKAERSNQKYNLK